MNNCAPYDSSQPMHYASNLHNSLTTTSCFLSKETLHWKCRLLRRHCFHASYLSRICVTLQNHLASWAISTLLQESAIAHCSSPHRPICLCSRCICKYLLRRNWARSMTRSSCSRDCIALYTSYNQFVLLYHLK